MKIKGLLVNVWAKPRVVEFESNEETIERFVGGDAEEVWLETDVVLYLNRQGKINKLPSTRRLCNGDPIAGNFILVGLNREGKDKSLTEKQISRFMNEFKKIELNRYTLDSSHGMPICYG